MERKAKQTAFEMIRNEVKQIATVCEAAAKTVLSKRELNNDELWALYEEGTITREDYHRRVASNLDNSYRPVEKKDSGVYYVVDMDSRMVVGEIAYSRS